MPTALFIRQRLLTLGLVFAVLATGYVLPPAATVVPSVASAMPTFETATTTARTSLAALHLGRHVFASAGATLAASKPVELPLAERTRISECLGKVPLYFVENQGQADEEIAYYVQGRGKTIYFTSEGVTFALFTPGAARRKDPLLRTEEQGRGSGTLPERYTVALDFLNANAVKPEGTNKSEAVINYFKGPKENWHAALPTYTGLSYRELWSGIDVVYEGGRSELKYTFHLKPGADPENIKLAYRGAESVALTDAGGLTVTTPAGNLHDGAPIAWQEIEGRQIPVSAHFTLNPEGEHTTIGFTLGDYDRGQPLVLDPVVLIYAGYIGGDLTDAGFAIAVDSSGNAYVTGEADSSQTTFPDGDGFGAVPGFDQVFGGGFSTDAFVVKVNPAGTALLYATYLGGSGFDIALGIAVDGLGQAYVTGETTSTDFPVLGGPDLTYNGNWDAFVTKLNASGTALVYSGYIGGSDEDEAIGIAVDLGGNAYVTGRTRSTESTVPVPFPVKVGPDLSYNGGLYDAFVAKVNATGTDLVYAGYIGGGGAEQGLGVAVDASGNAYVTGLTDSTEAMGFPVKVGPDLTYNGGFFDAFVAKVNAAGTDLVYAGYIGGNGYDRGYGIAVDGAGNAYVTGQTASTEAMGFPVKVGPDLTYNGGPFDAFVAKVNAAGTDLVYAGYIGGSAFESTYGGIAVDGAGNAYVTGETTSTETMGFPVKVGPDLTYNGGFSDAFVAKLAAAGTHLVYAGYIGGNDYDRGYGIAVDGAGNAYVTGPTHSADFPVTVGPDLSFNGDPLVNVDAFVAKIASCVTRPSGITAWWPLDETGGIVVHDIADGNNGTPKTGPVGSGGPTPGSGMVAGALSFNGTSDFVQVPNAPDLNFGTGSLSLDAWVKIPAPGTGFMPIVDKEIPGPTDAPYGYVFYVKDGHLGFAMSNDINVTPHAGIGADDTTLNLADNNWHHVAVTVQRNLASATGGSLFIDGAAIATATFSTIPFINLTADNIGDVILGSTNRLSRLPVSAFFNGWIDEVEIFNRALGPQDVLDLFDAGSAGKCKPTCVQAPAGMVGWWPLDEANGSAVVNDLAGVNNPGIPKPGGLLGNASGPSAIAGHVGGALYFVGSYIEVPPAGLNLANSNLTIDGWFAWALSGTTSFGGLPAWSPGHTTHYSIVDKLGTSPSNGYAFFVRSQATALPPNPVPGDQVSVTVDLAFALGSSIYTAQVYSGTTSFPLYPPPTPAWPYSGQWLHVAVTVDRNTNVGNFYLNGIPVGNGFTATAGADNTAPLWIGKTQLSLSGIEFSLDEIEIFNRALIPSEIRDIAGADSAGKCKCLLVSNERASCNPNGTVSYTFTVTNLSTSTVSGVIFSPPDGVTITPSSITTPLLPPGGLPVGGSTTVTVTISGAAPGGTICFTVVLVESGAAICKTDHCIKLPKCPRHLDFR